ncbi:MAG: tRNA pseudouridine(13) synthase TruD [Candidatus Micrarchaeota archaeon]
MKFRAYAFSPEEFIVEEITGDSVVLETGAPVNLGKPEDAQLEKDYFSRFVLQKRNWNTMQALAEISRRLRVHPKRFDFAGTKDRNSVSTQLCSAFAVPPERLLALNDVRDVRILGAWKSKRKVKLGDLSGNRFTITLTKENCGAAQAPNAKKIQAKAKKLGFRFPNYFGSQRFGSMRGNAAAVGAALLHKDFEAAVLNYLTFVDKGEREDAARAARARLAKEKDYSAALDYFPRFLKYERMLLEHLARSPRDYAGAFSRFPRHLQLLFVHALQSEIFNDELEAREKNKTLFKPLESDWWCPRDSLGFPAVNQAKQVEDAGEVKKLVEAGDAFLVGELVGADSKPTAAQEKLLKKKKLSVEDFRFTTLPWLSTRGGRRPLFAPLLHFPCSAKSRCACGSLCRAGATRRSQCRNCLNRDFNGLFSPNRSRSARCRARAGNQAAPRRIQSVQEKRKLVSGTVLLPHDCERTG